MALSVKAGNFQSGTGAINSTVAITGLGFQPKAILFFASSSGATSNTHASATLQRQAGFVDSSLNMRCVATMDQDGVSTSNTRTRTRSDSVTCQISTTNVITGQLSVNSLDADGFTMKVLAAYAASRTIMYLALGGSDLSSTKVGAFTAPATAVDKAVSGIGFAPDCLLFLSGAASSTPSSGTSSRFSLGAATKADLQNGQVAGVSEDNVGTSHTNGYLHMGDALTQIAAATGNMLDRGHVKSFDSDGFTTTWNTVNGGQLEYFYLALKGGSYRIRTVETVASTTTAHVIDGIGFVPRGGLFVNSDDPEDGAGNPEPNDDPCFGIWDSVASQMALEQIAYDNEAVMNNRYSLYFDAIHVIQNNAGTIKQVTNLTDVGSNSITIQPSTNTNIGNEFLWVLIAGDNQAATQADGAGYLTATTQAAPNASGEARGTGYLTATTQAAPNASGIASGAGYLISETSNGFKSEGIAEGAGFLSSTTQAASNSSAEGTGAGYLIAETQAAPNSDAVGSGAGYLIAQTQAAVNADGVASGAGYMFAVTTAIIEGEANGLATGAGYMYADTTAEITGGGCCSCSCQGEFKALYPSAHVRRRKRW